MKYATRINSFLRGGRTVVEALEAIGSIEGVDYVDMNYPEHFNGISVEKVKEALSENGLALNAINLRFRDAFLNGAFDNPNAEIRNRAISLCAEAAEVCRSLGGLQCIIWLGFDGFDYAFQKDYVNAWNEIVLCFQTICKSVGCRVSVEYKPYEERTFAMIDSWGVAWKLMEDVNCDNFGVTLDMCHMLMKKENPAYAAALLLAKNRLFGVHINDGEGYFDDGLMVGTVHIFKTFELFYYLMKYDYKDVIYFDTFPKRESAADECRINIKMCRLIEQRIREIGIDKIHSVIERQSGAAAGELITELVFGTELVKRN